MRTRASKHFFIKTPLSNNNGGLKEYKGSWSVLYPKFKFDHVFKLFAVATKISSRHYFIFCLKLLSVPDSLISYGNDAHKK